MKIIWLGHGSFRIEIEDQVAPKRVSHHRGIEHLVDVDMMCDKIKVACDHRQSDVMAIIANPRLRHPR